MAIWTCVSEGSYRTLDLRIYKELEESGPGCYSSSSSSPPWTIVEPQPSPLPQATLSSSPSSLRRSLKTTNCADASASPPHPPPLRLR
eukprot:3862945-Rhodomonas_salina.5